MRVKGIATSWNIYGRSLFCHKKNLKQKLQHSLLSADLPRVINHLEIHQNQICSDQYSYSKASDTYHGEHIRLVHIHLIKFLQQLLAFQFPGECMHRLEKDKEASEFQEAMPIVGKHDDQIPVYMKLLRKEIWDNTTYMLILNYTVLY